VGGVPVVEPHRGCQRQSVTRSDSGDSGLSRDSDQSGCEQQTGGHSSHMSKHRTSPLNVQHHQTKPSRRHRNVIDYTEAMVGRRWPETGRWWSIR
jgi:hypothetical protein